MPDPNNPYPLITQAVKIILREAGFKMRRQERFRRALEAWENAARSPEQPKL